MTPAVPKDSGSVTADTLGGFRRASSIFHHGPQSHAVSGNTAKVNATAVQSLQSHGLPVVRGIPLVAVAALPDRLRSIFSFPNFNAVQSKCYKTAYGSDDNLVVSAPTGSGKTVIFELAICRLLMHAHKSDFKVIYQAPTKSLCAERHRDWSTKFRALGLECAELTGDIESYQLKKVRQASIIITTPEKWDSITRKWKDQAKLMELVKLFLVDEIHTLKEDRGATLEAVICRMKASRTSIRFIALSATIPNCEDVATWLGRNQLDKARPAIKESFGEDFRPVPISKHVLGYRSSLNDFAFEKLLSSKLTDVVRQYGNGRPTLIFCSTRASCIETAKQLVDWWRAVIPSQRMWHASEMHTSIENDELKDMTSASVAFHHAGLSRADKTAVEQAFLTGRLAVICCTSTLATGLNLPCHMVVVKGTTKPYQATAGQSAEYSDLDIIQMLGRAGRPQFDNTSIAVIMTRQHRVEHYQQLISGNEVVESRLHLHLLDHINAELGLGTITDLASAIAWLSSTFLCVRLRLNPQHYGFSGQDLEKSLNDVCCNGIALLQEHNLVAESKARLRVTPIGNAMSYYCVQFATIKTYLAMKKHAGLPEILMTLSQAAEYDDIHFRGSEKAAYREINKTSAIRYPLQVYIDLPWQKVFLTIQMVLSKSHFTGSSNMVRQDFQHTKTLILKHTSRLLRCFQDCATHAGDAITATNALALGCSLNAEVWDDLPVHLTQLDGIGPAAVRKLSQAGLRTLQDMSKASSQRLEQAMSRNPPFGTQLLKQLLALPFMKLSLTGGRCELNVNARCIDLHVRAEISFINTSSSMTIKKYSQLCFIAAVSDGKMLHFVRTAIADMRRNGTITFIAQLHEHDKDIQALVKCEDIEQLIAILAGVSALAFLKSNIPQGMVNELKAVGDTPSSVTRDHAVLHHMPANIVDPAETRARILDNYSDAGIGDDDLDCLADRKPPKTEFEQPVNSISGSIQHADSSGRWQCRHTCKDKSICRHLCCREGLSKPPRPAKAKEIAPEGDADDRDKTSAGTLIQTSLSWPTQSTPAAIDQSRQKAVRGAHSKNSIATDSMLADAATAQCITVENQAKTVEDNWHSMDIDSDQYADNDSIVASAAEPGFVQPQVGNADLEVASRSSEDHSAMMNTDSPCTHGKRLINNDAVTMPEVQDVAVTAVNSTRAAQTDGPDADCIMIDAIAAPQPPGKPAAAQSASERHGDNDAQISSDLRAAMQRMKEFLGDELFIFVDC